MRPASPELTEMLEPCPEEIRALALAARSLILSYAPGSTELLYDSYNAVAVAFSATASLRDAFLHVAVYARHVNLGFNNGAALEDPDGLLQGTGKRIRHVRIDRAEDLEDRALHRLIRAAVAAGLRGARSAAGAESVQVRSRSAKRRRPRA